MDQDIREIESVTFGVYSPEEILNMSVCKVDSNKRSGSGTVYDGRMGTTDNTKECETCHEEAETCTGHFGHIELHEPIIHPLYYKQVVAFLKCFCTKCFKLLIVRDQVYLAGLNRFKGARRFEKILAKLEKVDICCQVTDEIDEQGNPVLCGNDQPAIKFGATDSSISMVYTDRDKNKTSIVLSVDEIKKTFDNTLDSDIELLGFDPKLVHPRNFIISYLPVIPPCVRPYVKQDGNICDDDLTNQYIEIIKANNHLGDTGAPLSETKRQKCIQSLKFRVLTMFNNSKGKAKHTTNGRPIKGIKERITGKDGQIRNNLMGKRCDQSARTVIGPDPTLKMGQLAIPVEMAEILTVPVRVAPFNIDILTEIVNTGRANFVVNHRGARINLKRALFKRGTRLLAGDVIRRGETDIIVVTGRETIQDGDMVKRNGEFLSDLQYPCKRQYRLNMGDVVERKLQDGDIVLLNRQPTLHKASMMAMEAVIKPFKTLRMNLAITKPFNADFDKLCRKQGA